MRSPRLAVPPLDLPGESESAFLADLRQALLEPPHAISPKYFYDAEGSRLFDRICELPEYYPTRTECAILLRHAADIATQVGPGCDLVEFGDDCREAGDGDVHADRTEVGEVRPVGVVAGGDEEIGLGDEMDT